MVRCSLAANTLPSYSDGVVDARVRGAVSIGAVLNGDLHMYEQLAQAAAAATAAGPINGFSSAPELCRRGTLFPPQSVCRSGRAADRRPASATCHRVAGTNARERPLPHRNRAWGRGREGKVAALSPGRVRLLQQRQTKLTFWHRSPRLAGAIWSGSCRSIVSETRHVGRDSSIDATGQCRLYPRDRARPRRPSSDFCPNWPFPISKKASSLTPGTPAPSEMLRRLTKKCMARCANLSLKVRVHSSILPACTQHLTWLLLSPLSRH